MPPRPTPVQAIKEWEHRHAGQAPASPAATTSQPGERQGAVGGTAPSAHLLASTSDDGSGGGGSSRGSNGGGGGSSGDGGGTGAAQSPPDAARVANELQGLLQQIESDRARAGGGVLARPQGGGGSGGSSGGSGMGEDGTPDRRRRQRQRRSLAATSADADADADAGQGREGVRGAPGTAAAALVGDGKVPLYEVGGGRCLPGGGGGSKMVGCVEPLWGGVEWGPRVGGLGLSGPAWI